MRNAIETNIRQIKQLFKSIKKIENLEEFLETPVQMDIKVTMTPESIHSLNKHFYPIAGFGIEEVMVNRIYIGYTDFQTWIILKSFREYNTTLKADQHHSFDEFEFYLTSKGEIKNFLIHKDWVWQHPEYMVELLDFAMQFNKQYVADFLKASVCEEPNNKIEKFFDSIIHMVQFVINEMSGAFLINCSAKLKPFQLRDAVRYGSIHDYSTLKGIQNAYRFHLKSILRHFSEVEIQLSHEQPYKLIKTDTNCISIGEKRLEYTVKVYDNNSNRIAVVDVKPYYQNQLLDRILKITKVDDWILHVMNEQMIQPVVRVISDFYAKYTDLLVLEWLNSALAMFYVVTDARKTILVGDNLYVPLSQIQYQTLEEFVQSMERGVTNLIELL